MTVVDPRHVHVDAVLAKLKDFQRATVDYVFDRMYRDPDPAHRFLVADEVGLGKTLIARGLIARAIERLRESVPRIDVVYICSNADIARQNVNRLNVTGEQEFAIADRITMLPVLLHNLRGHPLNFVSFTPGTSFELRTRLGQRKERALLYHLLKEVWELSGTGPLNVFQGNVASDRFRSLVREFEREHTIDDDLRSAFAKHVQHRVDAEVAAGRPGLRREFDELCSAFARTRLNVPREEAVRRNRFVGELRGMLAGVCIRSLEPDLIILDEFQRFKSLLDGDDDASLLARDLFDYSDEKSKARVLLLSATPYRMYTITDDVTDDDHYADFLQTLRFLQQDPARTARVDALLREYRRLLRRIGGDYSGLLAIKGQLETELRRVMVRTERLAASADRNGMLTEHQGEGMALEARDVLTYRSIQRVARCLEHNDTIEYWKSAPYLLSYMDRYQLKEDLVESVKEGKPTRELRAALRSGDGLSLSSEVFSESPAMRPPNPRIRWLIDDTLDRGLWKLLWMPPLLRYYRLGGPFAEAQLADATKRLVFSAWRVVPKAIATTLSYEAERRIFRQLHATGPIAKARDATVALLRFAKGSEGRLTGMPVLGLMYPSISLALAGDPLALNDANAGAVGELSTMLERVENSVRMLLEPLLAGAPQEGTPDESWYWAAPLLLDVHHIGGAASAWLHRNDLAAMWSGATEKDADDEGRAESSLWSEHLDRARQTLRKPAGLGRPPHDLARVLALMAIAAPGICALRTFTRVASKERDLLEDSVRDRAARVGWAIRNLFNLPEVTALIRGMNGAEPYWLRVLEYCADGGFQAVLDEYGHILRESLGLLDATPAEVAEKLAAEMSIALGLRTSVLGVDELVMENRSISFRPHRMRARFAVRFGEEENEQGKERSRADHLRVAFNSPFWPFVLATTSVGQEGLDFHHYCHSVVHWNLPSNPVDLEQREGRVHRFKGHAVRKNVVTRHAHAALVSGEGDPWERLFDAARSTRASDASDLVPFWIYPIDGGARIERHVPALPLSRDLERLSALRRTLAVYRMVFGQPRQDEVVEFLLRHMPPDQMREWVERLRIDLTPPPARARDSAQKNFVVMPADVFRAGPVTLAAGEADRPAM